MPSPIYGGSSGGVASLPSTTSILKGDNAGSALAASASDVRSGAGATTVGANLLIATNPSAISFPKVAADNTVSFRTPTQVVSDLSLVIGTNTEAWSANLDAWSALALPISESNIKGDDTTLAEPTGLFTLAKFKSYHTTISGTATGFTLPSSPANGDWVTVNAVVTNGPYTTLTVSSACNHPPDTGTITTIANVPNGSQTFQFRYINSAWWLFDTNPLAILTGDIGTALVTDNLMSGTPTFNAANLTGTVAAARLPNPTSSTLGGIESLAAVTSKWINTISTSGVPSATQPAFSDISGTATVAQGGTGDATLTAYAPLFGGTTTTAAVQSGAVGTAGQVLTSNGAGAIATFQGGNNIQTYSGDGSTGTHTFTLAGGFTNLRIIFYARSDNASNTVNVLIQFNSDTGANYDYEYLTANGAVVTGASSGGATSGYLGDCTAASGTASYVGQGQALISNYAGTTLYKAFATTGNVYNASTAGTPNIKALGGQWKSTSAITSVTVFLSAGKYVTGSKVECIEEN